MPATSAVPPSAHGNLPTRPCGGTKPGCPSPRSLVASRGVRRESLRQTQGQAAAWLYPRRPRYLPLRGAVLPGDRADRRPARTRLLRGGRHRRRDPPGAGGLVCMGSRRRPSGRRRGTDLAWLLMSSVEPEAWDDVIAAYGTSVGLTETLPAHRGAGPAEHVGCARRLSRGTGLDRPPQRGGQPPDLKARRPRTQFLIVLLSFRVSAR
jgi:hypothetical protein